MSGDELDRLGQQLAELLWPELDESLKGCWAFVAEALQTLAQSLEESYALAAEALAQPPQHPRPERRRPNICSPLLDQRRRIRQLRAAGARKRRPR